MASEAAEAEAPKGVATGKEGTWSLGLVNSLPHWPLLFMPKVKTSPSRVKTTTWALPKATWVT